MTTEHKTNQDSNQNTHFGFKTVAENEKAKKVGEVFHSVASKYDLITTSCQRVYIEAGSALP